MKSFVKKGVMVGALMTTAISGTVGAVEYYDIYCNGCDVFTLGNDPITQLVAYRGAQVFVLDKGLPLPVGSVIIVNSTRFGECTEGAQGDVVQRLPLTGPGDLSAAGGPICEPTAMWPPNTGLGTIIISAPGGAPIVVCSSSYNGHCA